MKYHLRIVTKQKKMFRSKNTYTEHDIADLQRQHSLGLVCYTMPLKDGSAVLIPAENIAYFEYVADKPDKVQV